MDPIKTSESCLSSLKTCYSLFHHQKKKERIFCYASTEECSQLDLALQGFKFEYTRSAWEKLKEGKMIQVKRYLGVGVPYNPPAPPNVEVLVVPKPSRFKIICPPHIC